MAMQRCPFCGEMYEPNPRAVCVKNGVRRVSQKACTRKICKKKRKAMSQALWLAKRPGVFRGLYIKTRLWLDKHPGYLRDYRAGHPDYVRSDNEQRRQRHIRERRRADIQDAIPRREIRQIQGVQGADIQDTIRLRLDGLLHVLSGSPAPICEIGSTQKEASG